jgi:conjugative relaxase-like TrwC/TraI family protein
VLSLAIGYDTGYLTGAVAGGREGYYTGAIAAGEPAGLWYGAGAERLGLSGEVDAELMEAVYTHLLDPRDPATRNRPTWGQAPLLAAPHKAFRSPEQIYADLVAAEPEAGPERRAELRTQAETTSRQAVSFIDATFSAPKSVTVLGVAFERAANDARAAGDERVAEAWAQHQRAVEDAVMSAARAGLDYLQDAAGYARAGHHCGGGGRWVDAHEFVVAQFLQHDSRDRDPQLHVHNAILNRVQGADGKWRALDSRTIHAHRGAAGAIAERVMEANLARSLGVEFSTRPDGKAREAVGIDRELLDLFSSRRHAITARTRELEKAFTARFGREPAPLERTRLAQQATLATRASKSHDGETPEQRLDRWEAEARRAVSGGLGRVADDIVARAQRVGEPGEWSERDVVERAVANVGERRASWSRQDLMRAVSDELPGHLGVAPDQVRPLLEKLTDRALSDAVPLTPPLVLQDLPPELLRASGESMFERPGSARFSVPGHLVAEGMLRQTAVSRGAAALSAEMADAVVARFAESGHELGADQAAAVRGVLTSGARVEVLSAAAGTGKTFTVGALTEAWSEAGHRVIGLAPSQVAADLLADEGLNATNAARWLQNTPGWLVPGEGDLVVVDEAGMASTTDLAEIVRRCDAAGSKLLLVGDARQLGAVGPGGALADVAAQGITYELSEVRRFSAGWERSASLGLRDADPAALDAYQRHGRLVDAGTPEQAEAAAARAWLADTLAGRESVLIVGSNEAAARVGAALRAQLVDLGRVEATGVELTQGVVAGVGDRVQARRNGWNLVGLDGNTRAPINRSTYTVTSIREDGGLTVIPVLGGDAMHLPANYVRADLSLAYASTVHAAQGRTVDSSHTVVGPGTDAATLYVGLTRGREHNTAWTITRSTAADAKPGEALDVEPRRAYAVLADALARAEADRTALAEREQAEITARSTLTHTGQLVEGISHVTAGRTAAVLDRLVVDGALTSQIRERLAADEAMSSLDRLLRTAELAGHDPGVILGKAVEGRGLGDARSPAKVIHHRITTSLQGQLTPQIDSAIDLVPRDVADGWAAWLHARAEAVDTRRHELGGELAREAPAWVVAALGPVPDDLVERAEWERRAGWAGAYRELAGHTDEADPLGAAPPAGLAESAAVFRAAHRALDLPEAGAEEADLSDGQLRMRVRAYDREATWAPRWVGDEVDRTHQAAAKAAGDAEIWSARASAEADPDERAQLQIAAEQAQREARSLAE